MAKEMAKPYQPPSLYDDEDNETAKRKKEKYQSGNSLGEGAHGQSTMESIDLLARDVHIDPRKSNNNAPLSVPEQSLLNAAVEVAPRYSPKAVASRPPSVVSEDASEDAYDDDDAGACPCVCPRGSQALSDGACVRDTLHPRAVGRRREASRGDTGARLG